MYGLAQGKRKQQKMRMFCEHIEYVPSEANNRPWVRRSLRKLKPRRRKRRAEEVLEGEKQVMHTNT